MVADASSLDQAGPITKTAEDAANMLNVLAGFDEKDFIQLTTPQFAYMTQAEFSSSIGSQSTFSDKTGRLTAGIEWFGFGAWKGKFDG